MKFKEGNTLGVANKTHGFRADYKKPKIYSAWCNIKYRCLNKNAPTYKYYGERGIKVCEEWLDFNNFCKDMLDEMMTHIEVHGERQTTIDRIDNEGNYEPSNCRWTTPSIQNTNKRKT